MNKLLRGTFGALALAAVALPAQAAPAPLAQTAVFHPGETSAAVQTVQYYSHHHPHYRFRRPFRHPIYRGHGHHRFYGGHHRFAHGPVPFRHY